MADELGVGLLEPRHGSSWRPGDDACKLHERRTNPRTCAVWRVRSEREEDMSLRGKRALITGSSRGIGRGIALKLAAEGVKVAINYRENADAANDTLAQVRASGSDGFVIQADVSRPDDIRRMFANIRSTWGRKLATLYRPRNLEGGNGLADALLRGGAGSTAYHGE